MISAVTTTGTGATTLIVTESLEVVVPSVQSKVRVVEPPTAGYQGCVESIGPPLPVTETPEGPEGEVSVQAVASVESQVYENVSPRVIVTGPSEPLALISVLIAAETDTGVPATKTATIR